MISDILLNFSLVICICRSEVKKANAHPLGKQLRIPACFCSLEVESDRRPFLAEPCYQENPACCLGTFPLTACHAKAAQGLLSEQMEECNESAKSDQNDA